MSIVSGFLPKCKVDSHQPQSGIALKALVPGKVLT